MTQTVSQVSAEQAYVGQTSRKPAQDDGEFRSLIRSAVQSGNKTESKKESGPDAVESNGGSEKEQPKGLPQNAVQTAAVPLIADFSAVLQNAPPVDSSAAETLFSVTDTAAASGSGAEDAQVVSAEPPVFREAAPADVEKPPVSGLEIAQKRTVPEQPKESFTPLQVSSDSAVPQKSTVPAQALSERTASGVRKTAAAEDLRPKNGEPLPKTETKPVASERAELASTKIPAGKISREGKAESGAAGETVRPLKKAEPSEKSASPGSLSDQYAKGNVVIKISDAKAAPKPSAAGQVAQSVAQQVRQGKQEFQVDLYPQSLGKVSVRLSSENGILTVEIAASNPKTQSMLLSGSEDIRSLLQNTTGRNVNVVQPEQPGGWYNRQDDGGSGYQRQEQDEEKQRKSAAGQGVRSIGAGGMSTGSFLSIMRGLA